MPHWLLALVAMMAGFTNLIEMHNARRNVTGKFSRCKPSLNVSTFRREVQPVPKANTVVVTFCSSGSSALEWNQQQLKR